MNKKLSVAFFGTSNRSTEILDALNNNFNLVLCITKNDVLVGRHQTPREVAVKEWATANKINVKTISSLKDLELEKVIQALDKAKPDYIIVADFSYIIPDELLEKFPEKIINIHFSLLPLYRGASPVQFAILNGDETIGITYHLVARKMDTGAIIHQIGYKMSGTETSGFLYDTLFELAARELSDVITKYHDKNLALRDQDEQAATYTLSSSHLKSTYIYKEDARINWKKSVAEIERGVRAFNPWPVAWCPLKELEKNKKLSNPKMVYREGINLEDTVKVYKSVVTPDAKELEILEIQPEGKRKMNWQEFANGYLKKES